MAQLPEMNMQQSVAYPQMKATQPMQPTTEAPAKLHAEMEQRQSEALSQIDYHGNELSRWQSVSKAVAAALESLNAPPQQSQDRAF